MKHTWLRGLMILLAVLTSAVAARAQGPVFAADPQPVHAPEFCPESLPPIQRSPFDNADHQPGNGFTESCPEECGPPCIFYFSAGALALQRQRPGNGTIAVADTGPGTDTGTLPLAIPGPGNVVAVRNNNVGNDYWPGIVGTLGVQRGSHALEISGFYISRHSEQGTVTQPGRLDLPFGAYASPPGFEGDNNLWLQADRVTVFLRSQLGSAEMNYRNIFGPEFELIFGVRYIDLREQFGIVTDDDGVSNPPPDPKLIATYQTQAINQILGGQIGFESNFFLIPERFALGFSDKNMFGVNFMEADARLIRGDGLTTMLGHHWETELAGAVELNAFATLWFNEHVRLRAGYQALWIFNPVQAHQQVNFDPNVPLAGIHHSDSVFYHGPRVELQFGF